MYHKHVKEMLNSKSLLYVFPHHFVVVSFCHLYDCYMPNNIRFLELLIQKFSLCNMPHSPLEHLFQSQIFFLIFCFKNFKYRVFSWSAQRFFMVFLSLSKQHAGCTGTLNYAMTTFFQILNYSPLIILSLSHLILCKM
jgi:hypothetical protein